jgi:NAD(P)-dependent dehydrogenase (short-subunit alcohol dehydrogenase family)
MSLESSSRVVVIGGTSGIGLAVARAAASAGAQFVVASRSAQSVERALDQIPDATGQSMDVTSPESLDSFFADIGEFDQLVYTAGDALVRGFLHRLTPRSCWGIRRTGFSLCGNGSGAHLVRSGRELKHLFIAVGSESGLIYWNKAEWHRVASSAQRALAA